MDLSDGLAKDLGRMCLASGVAARIAIERLPLSPAARTALAADRALIQSIAAGGDDYEVLAAVAPGHAAAYRVAAAAGGIAVTEIGSIETGAGLILRDAEGRDLVLANTGWDHFGAPRSGL